MIPLTDKRFLISTVVMVTVVVLIIGSSHTANAADDAAAFEASYKKGKNYYGFCMFCHGKTGEGTKLNAGGTMAPSLVGSPRVIGSKEIVTRILLHGLTGEVDGHAYENKRKGVMMVPPPAMMLDDDEILAGLLTYIRNSWGNQAPRITSEEVKRIRTAEAKRDKQWTLQELETRFPNINKK